MQEQQQQHLKTMLGLAHYGLHLPQQSVSVIGTGGGFCSTKGTGKQNCVMPVGPSLQMTAQVNSTPSSTVSSLINYLNVSSTSTLSASVSVSPVTSASTGCIPSNTINTSNNTVDNASGGMLSPAASNVCKTTESDSANNLVSSIVGNVSSSTSKPSNVDKVNDDTEFQNQKSPVAPPPSRMVTRSQTAAERMQPALDEGEHVKDDNPKAKKLIRASGSDLDEDYSPHKVKREILSTSGIVFDDFSYAKNPAGAGIEFGAVCPDCGAVAVTGVGWNAHQQAHRNESTACMYCNQVFLTEHGRQMHQQLHRDGQTRDVDDFCECGICGGSFISVLYLELHLLELHGRDALSEQRTIHLGPSSNADPSCPPEDESDQQLFRCGVCRSLFTYSLNLDCHMALHSEVSYCCAICDAAFPTLDPLVTHSKAHRYAGHVSTPSGGVQVHMTQSPVPTRPPPCPVFQPPTNTSFNVWKPQPAKSAFHSRTIPQNTSGFIHHSINNAQATHPGNTKVVQQPSASMQTTAPSLATAVMTTTATQPMNPTVMASMAPMMSSPLISAVNPIMTPNMAPAVTPVMTAPMTPAMLNYYMMMTLWGGNKTCGNQGNIPVWQNYLNPAMANVFNYFNPYLLNNHNNGMNNTLNTGENQGSSQSPYFKQDNCKEHDNESREMVCNKSDDCIVEDTKS